jgi:hypothetical protein
MRAERNATQDTRPATRAMTCSLYSERFEQNYLPMLGLLGRRQSPLAQQFNFLQPKSKRVHCNVAERTLQGASQTLPKNYIRKVTHWKIGDLEAAVLYPGASGMNGLAQLESRRCTGSTDVQRLPRN